MNISPKLSHILSAAVSIIFVIYFFYQGFLAYVILKELGGGVDALVASRWGLSSSNVYFCVFIFSIYKNKRFKKPKNYP